MVEISKCPCMHITDLLERALEKQYETTITLRCGVQRDGYIKKIDMATGNIYFYMPKSVHSWSTADAWMTSIHMIIRLQEVAMVSLYTNDGLGMDWIIGK